MSGRRITILGAGLGGLCAAIQLKAAGHEDIVIFEKADRVGGTWRANTYPGCSCDVPVALYQYSFAPGIHWTSTFPAAGEIQLYAEQLADQFALRAMLRLSCAAVDARWDEAALEWVVTGEDGSGRRSDVLVAALGQLDRPMIPDFPGRDRFQGPLFHSAAWDHGVPLAGRRVGVIGSAASAVQLIPEVAKEAGALVVFQRTPNWIGPRRDQPVSDAEKALLFTDPAMAMDMGARQRQLIFDNADTFFWQAFSWTPAGRAAFTEIARRHLEAQVPDPALRAKLTPDYPVGCTRFLFADDFYPALCRPNVTLETSPVAAIGPDGVTCADGARHALDVIVCATGFETTAWRWSLEVTGAGGQTLSQAWADGAQAYLGLTVTGFPNLFLLYGPNTNLGHNSITWMIERQCGYIVQALSGLEGRGRAMEVTGPAQERFNQSLQERLAGTVWADPACHSWYKNAAGRITQNWSGSCMDYGRAVADVAWDDYRLTG